MFVNKSLPIIDKKYKKDNYILLVLQPIEHTFCVALNWGSFSSFYKDFIHFAVIQQFPSGNVLSNE